MINIQLEHFLTYIDATSIDDYLKEYETQGFTPHKQTVRHEPSLRNGFIFFGPEYLEFLWVEDEKLFAEGGAEASLVRATRRPFGLGLRTDDVQGVHDDWTRRGYAVPEVWSKAPRDATSDTPPIWSFQDIPSELLSGVVCFVLTYHTSPQDQVRKVHIPPNTIYAISGVTFVTVDPEARAASWGNLLASNEQVTQSRNGFVIVMGPHQVRWMTPDAYQVSYGRRWQSSPHAYGELALLHFLAADLSTAQTMMEQAGRDVKRISQGDQEELLVEPDIRDGFTFLVRQQPIDAWLRERKSRTGEELEIEDRI